MVKQNARVIDAVICLVLFLAMLVVLPKDDDTIEVIKTVQHQDRGCNSCHENYKG